MEYIFKRYKAWENRYTNVEDLWLGQYIADCIHPEDLVIFIENYLFPIFSEYKGCILLGNRSEEQLEKVFTDWGCQYTPLSSEDKNKMESLLNHIHLEDLFLHTSKNVSPEIFDRLLNLMRFGWGHALYRQFPDKKFQINIFSDTSDFEFTISMSSL